MGRLHLDDYAACFNRGFDAYYERPDIPNPHTKDTPEHEAWEDGWATAREQALEKDNEDFSDLFGEEHGWIPDSPEEAQPYDPADEPGTPEYDSVLAQEWVEDFYAMLRRESGND